VIFEEGIRLKVEEFDDIIRRRGEGGRDEASRRWGSGGSKGLVEPAFA
jgi:hypothetical protein